ncbi:MAG TPA: hypothetical protein VF037_02440 [Gemmatimonadales bacterium]
MRLAIGRVGAAIRLLAIGAAAGAVAGMPIVLSVFALRGHAEAVLHPQLWLVAACMGAIVGGLVLPVLGMTVLRAVPLRLAVLNLAAGAGLGVVAFAPLRSAGLGLFAGLTAATVRLALRRAGPRAPARPAGT